MRWYQGGIADAVSASKKSGAIFLVYVEGKDNKSKEITTLLNNDEVSQMLETQYFVAIKVEEGTVPHQQFSQIYKDATGPSLFFIGKAGNALEIIREPHTPEQFMNKVDNILQSNGVNISQQIRNLINAEQFQENANVASNGIVHLQPSSSKNTENDETKLSKEEQVDRAKDLLNQKREAKNAEEEENARLKEVERRKMGQDVQKLKRWQQDNELKELMDERNKEKKEQQEARQRVLAQIAQDKAERASKFGNASHSTQQSPQNSPQSVLRAVNNNHARLQFRLPDGSSHTHQFLSTATLQDVRNYITANINLPFTNFTLSTTFPRREFTNDNNLETLLALELVPNAVILILPLHGSVSEHSNSLLMTIFWSIVAPILNMVGYLKNIVFGTRRPPPGPEQGSNRHSENTGEPSNLGKRKGGETTAIRRQGNIHRLTDKTDSDEENNTWNGNSTQQM